jgi:hypothetical protein
MTPSWFRHARHGLLLVALMAALPLAAARAGQTLLDPGASGTIDTGERGNYTATTIYNLGDQAGRVEFGAPIDQVIEVPAGGQVELNGNYRRPAVQATNRGPTRLRILTRYFETVRGP